jgi:hypothetical protein
VKQREKTVELNNLLIINNKTQADFTNFSRIAAFPRFVTAKRISGTAGTKKPAGGTPPVNPRHNT